MAHSVSAVRAQKEAGVERFVYVSAERFRPVAPLLTGYYDGKGAAEDAVDAAFGGAGAILRPPAIYGSRQVSATLALPLGAVGVPLSFILSLSPVRALAAALGPLGDLLAPWVSVDTVASSAVALAANSTPAAANATATRANAGAYILGTDAMIAVAAANDAALPPAVTLFWDGGCPLCRKEIAYYKELDRSKSVRWVDIHSNPSELEAHGIEATEAMRFIHGLDADGNIVKGVPAFLAVWEHLPYWRLLPPLVRGMPMGVSIASSAYAFWAKHRLNITGRARDLDAASACPIEKDK